MDSFTLSSQVLNLKKKFNWVHSVGGGTDLQSILCVYKNDMKMNIHQCSNYIFSTPNEALPF